MKSFSRINFFKLSLVDAVLYISQIIRTDFAKDFVVSELNKKVQEAKTYISTEIPIELKLEKLLYLFYKKWNFREASGVYKLSNMLWIDKVLKTHEGTAVSLGIILLYFAKELDIPLYPVVFPTQLIIRADFINKKTWFINPFNGEFIDKHTLEVWLKGNISPIAELYEYNLYKSDPIIVLRKILDTLKSTLIEERQIELSLNVSNLLISIYPNDPYEIRDRGLIYAQLECHHIALKDLIYFVKHCPEDPISEIIKIQIYTIQQKKIVIH